MITKALTHQSAQPGPLHGSTHHIGGPGPVDHDQDDASAHPCVDDLTPPFIFAGFCHQESGEDDEDSDDEQATPWNVATTSSGSKFREQVRAFESKNLDIFSSLYKELNIYYVDETDAGELMKTGIDAMLESLDPYTTYIPESEKEDFEFMTTGQYGGIGAIITKNGDWVYVSEPYEGFPADKAGLIAGISTSQVSGDQLGGFNKLGLKLGGSVNHFINSASRGQLALYYIDKGSNDVNSDFRIDLSYIETSWCVQKTSKGFIYEGGLLFGVLLDGKTFDIYGYEDTQKNDFHKFDIGAKLAAGIKLKPQLTMFWELSNSIPFFPIQKHPGGTTYGLNKGKYNSILSFSFRYLFSE